MTHCPNRLTWTLVPLVAVLLAAVPLADAPTMHMVQTFTVGPKPAGFTYPKDRTWTVTSPFVRLSANRYMLVGEPLWVWLEGARVATKKAFPVLDLDSNQISFPTAAL